LIYSRPYDHSLRSSPRFRLQRRGEKMGKFHGPFDRLQAAVAECKLNGNWFERPNGLHCFRAKTGEALNWWPRPGRKPSILRASCGCLSRSSAPRVLAKRTSCGQIYCRPRPRPSHVREARSSPSGTWPAASQARKSRWWQDNRLLVGSFCMTIARNVFREISREKRRCGDVIKHD
jgi:hypothetical protein